MTASVKNISSCQSFRLFHRRTLFVLLPVLPSFDPGDCLKATHIVVSTLCPLHFHSMSLLFRLTLILFRSFAGRSMIVSFDSLAMNNHNDRFFTTLSLFVLHSCLICSNMYRWAFEDCFAVYESLASLRVSLVNNTLYIFPTTYDCQVYTHVGYCKKHMVYFQYHPKMYQSKQGTTGKVELCGECLNGNPPYTQRKKELISRSRHGRCSCSQKEAITMYGS